ncbi:MAG TPA: PD-(D/E)XK nuclease family protein [Gemmatimonadota bacterium]|nr:PD-(D/E)XK nuclease family protein [Gemmatimonadota bacterium]
MLIVVPSRRVAARIADAALAPAAGGLASRAASTGEIVTLSELVDRILAAHPDPRSRLSELGTAYLVDDLVEGLESEVRHLFGPGAEGPGAARAIGAAIRELRGAGLAATDLVPPARASRRIRALAATLDAYERRLAKLDLWDEADALRATAGLVRAGSWPTEPLDSLEVVGLYDVSPLQGRLLLEVARRAGRVRVAIPFDPQDPDATAYAYPYVHLWESLADPALDIEIEYPDPERTPTDVRFATAADPTDEARQVADWARSKVDGGVPAEAIAVVLAGGAGAARRIARELARRGVPHRARRASLLGETPAFAAAMLPFRLIEEGFRRADVEAWIASPLTRSLDAATLLAAVRKGPPSGAPYAEWGRVVRDVQGAPARSLNAALERIESLGRAERSPAEFWPAYGEALATAGLGPDEAEPAAWEAWERALRDLRAGLEAVGRWEGPPAGWRFHRRKLLDAIANQRERIGRPGRGVTLLTPRDARGLRFHHAAMVGLSRGSLAGPDPAGQVLGDRERRALNEAAGERLFRSAPEAAREGALLLAERMRETAGELLLSCPLESDDSTPLLPALEYEAARRARGGDPPASPPVGDAPAWRLGRDPFRVVALQTIERDRASFLGLAVETRRGDGGRHGGAFEPGRAAALLELVADGGRLGRWSASQLESWRQCPHQFFQRYVLGLKPGDERPVEAEPNAVGTLVHRALHLLHEAGLGPEPPDRAAIEAALVASEPEVDLPLRGDPAVWAVTRRRTAAELAHYFALVWEKSPPRGDPVGFELAFGLEDDGPPGIPLETRHGTVSLRGRLDRLDRDPATGALHVVDYKHAKRRKSHHEAVDENLCGVDRFQLYAYFLAALAWAEREGHGPPPGTTGAIHCIREPRVLGALVAPPEEEIRARVTAAIEQALAGRYDPSPRDPDVCGYCDFRRSCRIATVAAGYAADEPEEDA